MFQVDLSNDGGLLLYLPTGRAVEISATPEGVGYIMRVLREYHKGLANQPGFIRNLPTQHAIEKWMKEDKKKKREAKSIELGVNIDKMEFKI